MNKTKIFSGLLAVSLASTALYAAPGMNADGTTKAEAMAKADARFAKMDANSDGTLNQADRAAKVKERFAVMDADKNGALSEAEFIAAHDARMTKREDRRERRMGRGGADGMEGGSHKGHRGGNGGGMRMLAAADANGDNSVTQAEFRTATEARFAKADTNNDGTVSADERKAQRTDKRGGKWGQRPVTSAPADAS